MDSFKNLPPATDRVAKRPVPVQVRFATAPGVCPTREGSVAYEAGDALLTGIAGETWPVASAAFHASYAPAQGTTPGTNGAYIKTQRDALAVRLTAPLTVPSVSLGSPLQGQPGDYLLRYADGNYGIVAPEIFIATYDILGPA